MSHQFDRGITKTAGIHAAVRKMFRTTNIMKLYREFYVWCENPTMFKVGKGKILEYSDIFPLVYLKIKVEGATDSIYKDVRHLVVDEMQDYTPVQCAVLSQLFKCKMTILGDANQSVNPYGSSSYREIQQVFTGSECFKLNKSYRSNYEIMNFAQEIHRNEELISNERHGEHPVVKILESEDKQVFEILKDIETGRKQHSSIGIICKTQNIALRFQKQLNFPDSSVTLLTPESMRFTKGIVITTAHMAKGLEFDQVIIPFADPHTYNTDIDRSMFYIACTRALHSLHAYSVKSLTPFIRTDYMEQI